MNENIIPNPWTEWKRRKDGEAEIERKLQLSNHKRRDWDLAIRELGKLTHLLTEGEVVVIRRLRRLADTDLLTHTDFNLLGKAYHRVRKEYPHHISRCPVCKDQLETDQKPE